jgi:hypothetical protein
VKNAADDLALTMARAGISESVIAPFENSVWSACKKLEGDLKKIALGFKR